MLVFDSCTDAEYQMNLEFTFFFGFCYCCCVKFFASSVFEICILRAPVVYTLSTRCLNLILLLLLLQ